VRILYVEDNPANLFLVQRVARMGNHQVINYSEGQSALDNFVRDKPDLILMDVQLPGKLTGLDVVKALREAGHKTPIIAVTAYAMIGDRERCLQVGCNGYIAKPLPVGELVEVIKQYADQLGVGAATVPAPTPVVKPDVPVATAVKSEVKPEVSIESPAKTEFKPEAATIDTTSATEPEKSSVPVSTTTPPTVVTENKLAPEVQKSSEATEPEKPTDLESAVSGSQNTPTTLSSKHQ